MNPHARAAARTAGGAAGSARNVVRVVGGSENLVVALQVAGIDRQVGFAEDDRASLAQSRDRPCIFFRDEGVSSGAPEVVRIPAVWKESLIVIGTPWRGPLHLAARECGIGGVGFGAGADRRRSVTTLVDGLIESLDAREEIVEGLAAGNLAPPDFSRNSGSAQMGKLGHGGLLWM